MKNTLKVAGAVCIAYLIAGCQGDSETAQSAEEREHTEEGLSQNTDSDTEQDTKEEMDQNNEDEEESTNEESENESDYDEEIVQGSYLVNAHSRSLKNEADNLIGVYMTFQRTQEERSFEERLIESLVESDYSGRNILENGTSIKVDGQKVEMHFHDADNHPESLDERTGNFFLSQIHRVVDLFGIEEITYLNEDEELDLIIGDQTLDEPVHLSEVNTNAPGYFISYAEELEETLFVSVAGEEDRSFSDTIKDIGATPRSEDRFSSAIYEDIDIVDTAFEDEIAIIHYSLEDGAITEEEQVVFERAMQLTALDFHANELHLINETKKTKSVYPLLNDR